MTRRAAIAGASAGLISFANAVAQSPQKILRIGHVSLSPRSAPHNVAFVKRMGELGYQEGTNFTYDFLHLRSFDEYSRAYRELAQRGCDVLIATGTEAALRAAVSAAENQIAVVFFALDFDPFARGFVTSLAKPGGNMTGIFVRQIELAKKRVELARQAMPEARALWLLWDAASRDQAEAAAEVARTLAFEPHLVEAGGEPPAVLHSEQSRRFGPW
jgi:putative ABC transport system substrate-binding protein